MRQLAKNARWALAVAVLASCHSTPVTAPKPAAKSAGTPVDTTATLVTPSTATGLLPSPSGNKLVVVPTIPADAVLRPVSQAGGVALSLSGQVYIIANNGGGVISDHGIGVISNNGGSVVSNNGAGIISNNGGGLISEAGGGLISEAGGGLTSKTKFFRLADTPPPTVAVLLADAQVELVDAQGRLLVDENSQPIAAKTDATGTYHFKGVLPPGNLFARIRLGVDPNEPGAQLLALLVQNGGAPSTLDINTQTSLGANYIQRAYLPQIKDQTQLQAKLDLLKPADVATLTSGVVAALTSAGTLAKAPTYLPADQQASTDVLRKQTSSLDAQLVVIQTILGIGQSDEGNGLPVTTVPLAEPTAVTSDGKGHYFIAELTASRIREVDDKGIISLFAGLGKNADTGESSNIHDGTLGPPVDLQAAPDGSLIVVEGPSSQVRRLTPDGQAHVIAGTGTAGAGVVSGPAASAPLTAPSCAAIAPDGTVYIADLPAAGPRVLAVNAAGTLAQLPTAEPFWANTRASGLAAAADGGLYAILGNGTVAYRAAGATSWVALATGPADGSDGYSRIVADPAGGCYVSRWAAHQVVHVAPDGKVSVIAGTGTTGADGDGGPATAAQVGKPCGLFLGANHQLLVTDIGNGLIRGIDLAATPPTISTLGGSRSEQQVGPNQALGINQPAGLFFDASGNLLFTEAASGTVKKLVNNAIQLVAGTTVGFAGDNGPATAAELNGPSSVTSDGKVLYIMDAGNHLLRRVNADGTIAAVAGVGGNSVPPFTGASMPAAQAPIGRALSMALGPDGQPWWVDNALDLVLRLDVSGNVVVVAGKTPAHYDAESSDSGDGGLATAATLNHPYGIAFDSKGVCYVSDTFNMRIRKIDSKTGIISPVAGESTFATILGAGDPTATNLLVAPGPLAMDAHDNLYIAELGTLHLSLFSLVSGGGTNMLASTASLPRVPARIRRIAVNAATPSLTTIAGQGGRTLIDPFGDEAILLPLGLALTPDGGLAVADAGDDQVKFLPASALTP